MTNCLRLRFCRPAKDLLYNFYLCATVRLTQAEKGLHGRGVRLPEIDFHEDHDGACSGSTDRGSVPVIRCRS